MADLQEAIRTKLPPDEDLTTGRRVEAQDKRVRVDSLRLELAAAVAAVADACEEMLKPLESTSDFQLDMDDLLALDESEAAMTSQSVSCEDLDSGIVNDLLDLDVDKWNEMNPDEGIKKLEDTRSVDDSQEETLEQETEEMKNEKTLRSSVQVDDQGRETGDAESIPRMHEVKEIDDNDSATAYNQAASTIAFADIDDSAETDSERMGYDLAEEMHAYSTITSDERAARSTSATLAPLQEQDCAWMSYTTENGVPYYYNSKTQVSQWTRPELQPRTYPADAIFDAATGREPFASQISSILQSGINIDVCNNSGLTPLHVACREGNVQAVMELIHHGASINGQSNNSLSYGETPLWEACKRSDLGIVRLLVNAGCRQNVTDSKANTLLHLAVQTKNDDLLSFFLENSDVSYVNLSNSDGETPLHLAAQIGFVEGVQILLDHGAGKEVEDSRGRTALVLSIMENHIKCVQILQTNEISNKDHEPAATPAITPLATESDGVSDEMTMEDLQSYLFQLLEGSDSQLYNAFYQFANGVHSHFTSMEKELEDMKRKDESHEAKIKDMATAIAELNQKLAMARETAEAQVADKLNQHALEFQALESSCRTLEARCDMLDSVARSAQEKLQRERLEFAHYEQQLQEQIRDCLVENKDLFSSIENLRAAWNQQPQHAREVYENSEAQSLEEKSSANDESPVDQGKQYDQMPYTSKATPPVSDTFDDVLTSENFRQLVITKPSNQHDTESVNESPPTVSPARVDAVWNRFFENLVKSAESQNLPTANAPLQREHFRSQPQQSSAQSAHIQASLFDAIRKSHMEYLEELLLDGLSPNARDIGEKGTPLHLACELGDLEAVVLLCEFAADLESRDESGYTPLLVSCFQGHYDCTKFLLQSAANLAAVNVNGDTPLHLAAWDGSYACVEILVEYGVDIFCTNNFGLTALTNLKTRSPLRHRFDDLTDDHPMRKTIVLLEECEQLDEEKEQDKSTEELVESTSDTHRDDQTRSDAKINKATWKEWIFGLGRSKGQSEIRDPSIDGDTNDAKIADSDDSEDDNDSERENDESISSDSENYQLGKNFSSLKYELVRPPPEIEAELRRAAERANQRIESLASLPPSPTSVSESVHKRKLLSPMQRIAASTAQKKKLSSSATTTHVRARYVDTFNPTTI